MSLGKRLDEPCEFHRALGEGIEPRKLREPSNRDGFIEEFLKIRTKRQGLMLLQLNRAQREYSRVCSQQKVKKNLVLKARQVGVTTYIAARFFVQTITQPGILSMQVTQDRESAEDIFRIVRRFWENLPEEARKGCLRTSYRSARHLVFPSLDSEYCLASAVENAGRGRTIQNLHCSEVSRWGREGDEALASLRAAVVTDGDIVLESTPNGAGGLFYEEWQRAEDTGYTRHFFPWWYDEAYVLEDCGNCAPLTEEETELKNLHGLKDEQIAWRRKQWASLRGLAVQEFAEDAVSCFLASGECVFDVASLERAFADFGRTAGDAGQRATDDLAAGASGTGVCDWSRSGGRRDGRGLFVRGSDRSIAGNAVCGVARTLASAGVCAETSETWEGIQHGAAGGGGK